MDNAITKGPPKDRPKLFVLGVYGNQKFLYVFLDTFRGIFFLALHLTKILKCHAATCREEEIPPTQGRRFRFAFFISFLPFFYP